jgi:IS605 OrfB family transposase
MKIIRSTKCSLKFTTEAKQQELQRVLEEYGRVVNVFIDMFWERTVEKSALLKEVVNRPETWLTARLRKVAAREAIDMIKASRERDGAEAVKPVHKGQRMSVSSTIASLEVPQEASEFDAWLKIRCVGEGIGLDLPIRFHKHFSQLASHPGSVRLNSYIITAKYVQLAFEIETGRKKTDGEPVAVDTGVNVLAALSTGLKLGLDIKELIEAINRCEYASKHQQRLRRALKQRMDEVAKEIMLLAPALIVVERLSHVKTGTKKRRRLGRKTRRLLGPWAYRYWLNRLRMACEWNRVSYRSVPPAYTSQRCSRCGHTEQGNRLSSELFRCRACGYADAADVNAARNILSRFLTGAYGPGSKTTSLVRG